MLCLQIYVLKSTLCSHNINSSLLFSIVIIACCHKIYSLISLTHFVSCLSKLFYSSTSPSLHVCLLVLVVVASQVENMNYLAGRRCSAWKTAVSMVRMDEERQERDETDSSSQHSSIPPSFPLLCALCVPPLKSFFFFFPGSRYKEIFATTFQAKDRMRPSLKATEQIQVISRKLKIKI